VTKRAGNEATRKVLTSACIEYQVVLDMVISAKTVIEISGPQEFSGKCSSRSVVHFRSISFAGVVERTMQYAFCPD
jgi:hypothetical protein